MTKTEKVTIIYNKDAAKLDSIAAHLLAEDIERVTSYLPVVTNDLSGAKGNVIIIGSIASPLIQKFAATLSPSFKKLHAKRECYGITLVQKPSATISKALVVAGSDKRGTAYGVFTLSEKIGVSPWYWWADVPSAKKDELVISGEDFFSKPPSVTFRGIFINDEDWGLRPWAAKTFEPGRGNIGPATYAKVFELLLRLRANFLWPAMHPGTRPFYDDPENKRLAAEYGIIIGSSHAEPMLRNNVGEWNEKTMGDFNYVTNRDSVYAYWESRVKETSTNEVVYTLGMRGVHDSGIEGVKNSKEAVPLLERIMSDQRALLKKYLHKEISSIPQAFTAYKEVLDIYDNGLRVADDVTLVWPDDNYGYIQRLSTPQEQKRPGGAGVYYHASYWGRPHDYLWLSTTHPSLMREEMVKAFEHGAGRIWVLNVGDIKPLEYNIQLFLDMAYDISPFKDSKFTKFHLARWTKSIFGDDHADEITSLLWQYYRFAFERRPEFMGWSQTEPTTKTSYTEYNHFNFGDEAQKRIDAYEALEQKVKMLRPAFGGASKDAFYQLVYYPVVAASLMNKKFLYRDKAMLYAKQNRISASSYAGLSMAAYDSIVKETAFFNEQLTGGKWKNMMSMKPRDLPVFAPPDLPVISIKKGMGWDAVPEGYDTLSLGNRSEHFLPVFREGMDEAYFIDIFLKDSTDASFSIQSSMPWIQLSRQNFILLPQKDAASMRIWVSVDWSKVPLTEESGGAIRIMGSGRELKVGIRALRRKEFGSIRIPVFTESNGLISIAAAHYNHKWGTHQNKWQVLHGIGAVDSSMIAIIANKPRLGLDSQNFKGHPFLSYDFYSFSTDTATLTVYTLPTHPLNRNYGMRYGVSMDDGPVQILDFSTQGRSEEWKQNVLRNQARRAINLSILRPGKHSLKVYAVDPGVILDRILIRFGSTPNPYGFIPETVKKPPL